VVAGWEGLQSWEQSGRHGRGSERSAPAPPTCGPCWHHPHPVPPSRRQGVPVQVIEVPPSRVTAEWLARKVPELARPREGGGGALAADVAAALAKAGLADAEGNLKVRAPRQLLAA
jgi:hypothetical protein